MNNDKVGSSSDTA